MAVGEMAAVGEVHGEDFVAGLQDGEVDGHVRLRAAVGLDVDVFAAEELLGAVDGELLDDIDVFAAAVPAFPGIALGVFVREATALRFHDGAAGEVFGGDELDVFALPFFFGLNDVEDFGIDLAKAAAKEPERSACWDWKRTIRPWCKEEPPPVRAGTGTASSLCSTNASTLGKAFLIVAAQSK